MKVKCKTCHSEVEECGFDINATDDGDVIEDTQYFCPECVTTYKGDDRAYRKIVSLYISISKGILPDSDVYFEDDVQTP